MIEIADLGWMSGIIDLKGRIVVKKNKQRATPQIILAVQSKEYPVVRRLSALVGTAPELMKAKPPADFMRRQCDEHCPEAHIHVSAGGYPNDGMPPTARWTITGVGMAIVLTALEPYLQVDRGYGEAVGEITANMVHEGQGVGMVRKQIERMKELGWPIPKEIDRLSQPVFPPRVRAERPPKFVTANEVENMINDALGWSDEK